MARHQDIETLAAGTYRLRAARVPGCLLNAPVAGAEVDADGASLVDITVRNGRIEAVELAGSIPSSDIPCLDLNGRQVWSTLVDIHAHLDKGQAIPRVHCDGTLDGASAISIADRRNWSHDDIARRMRFGLRCAYVHGVSAIRTHLDSPEGIAERGFAVFREMRAEWAGKVELQAVGMVLLPAFRGDYGVRLANLVAESGAVLGGVTDAIGSPNGEPVYPDLDRLLDTLFRLADERGLDVDLHVDQTANPAAFTLLRVAEAAVRNRFKGRVLCDHCVNLSLLPDEVARRAIERCADAGIAVATMPTPMMYLMDRSAGRTPRWRGVTLAKELIAAGVTLAIGGDNCRDAWFPFGDHDMVDTFQQAVRVFQLDDPLGAAPAAVGPNPAAIAKLPALGSIRVGDPAKLIIFSARTMNEFMCRPQSDRIVIDRGFPVVDELPSYEELDGIVEPRPGTTAS